MEEKNSSQVKFLNKNKDKEDSPVTKSQYQPPTPQKKEKGPESISNLGGDSEDEFRENIPTKNQKLKDKQSRDGNEYGEVGGERIKTEAEEEHPHEPSDTHYGTEFIHLSDNYIHFSDDKVEPRTLKRSSIRLEELSKNISLNEKEKRQAIELIESDRLDRFLSRDKPNSENDIQVKIAIRKRKFVRYCVYFIYLTMLVLGLMTFFKYSLIRHNFLFQNLSSSNITLKLAIDNCSLFIIDSQDQNTSHSVYIEYFMPPGHESGSRSVGNEFVTENSLTVNILNAGDAYYCLGKIFINAEATPLESLEITCGKCNITQDTSSRLQVNGLLNLTGDSLHANFRDIKVGSISYQSFTGHLQFNNIESDEGVNNITMNGEGDIIIQSIQDYIVNATTNTQAFCFSGTSLGSIDNGTCIYSDQDQPIPSRYKTCTSSWRICISEECNPTTFPTYIINSTNGNVYANAISKVGKPVNARQIASGQIYNQGIRFSSTAEEVLENFDQYVADPDKSNPFVVLNVGDIASRSSKYAKWIVSSVPSYALMKPWWVGTFSGAMLQGYVKGANGILLPGFCPFYPDYTTTDLLSMQNLIFSKIATPYTLVTFVVDEAMPAPTDKHQNYTGVFPLIEGGNPSDRWFSLALSEGGKIFLQNNDYTKKGEILLAIIVSLVIAGFVTFFTLKLTCSGISVTYVKLVDFSNHLISYKSFGKSKEKEKEKEKEKQESYQDQKTNEESKNENTSKTDTADQTNITNGLVSHYGAINFLKYAPSPLAFIDYLSLIFFRQFTNSVAQFYFLLFQEQKNADDLELDPGQTMIKGTELKALYEKFCFMNHLNEQKLTDSVNQAQLKSYGFEIATREDLKSEVFTKLIIKQKKPFLVSSKLLKNQDSLQYYMNENVKITQFTQDQIEVQEFIRLYKDFCNYNRLPRVQVSTSLMREKYGIEVRFIPQQYIFRAFESKKQISEEGFFAKLKKKFQKAQEKISVPGNRPKKYIIDKFKVENHFKLLMDENTLMTKEQLKEATKDLILYPRWYLWDLFTVLLHLLLGLLITAPLIYFVVLNESQYQPWSLKDNQYLIRYNDFLHDPLQFTKNLYSSFTWNVALMILATSLWIISSFDLMVYYAIMEFPQDSSFKKAQERGKEHPLERLSRQIEWIFVLMALVFYFGFLTLILIWLLLGAFINPTTFLPFASAALTFVVFVVSKFRAFEDVFQQGTKKIMTYVNKIFGKFTNSVVEKIATSIEGSGKVSGMVRNEFNQRKNPNQDISLLKSVQSDFQSLEIPAEVSEIPLLQTAPSQNTVVVKAVDPTDLREKKKQRIRDESKKRGIPPLITELMLSIILQDRLSEKINLRGIINTLNTKKNLPEGGAYIISELLFPEGIKNEETVLYNILEILYFVLKQDKIKENSGLTGEILYEIYMMFKDLDDQQYDRFMENFNQLLQKHKNIFSTDIEIFLPILDIAAVLSKEKPDHWNIKSACFKLFRIAEYLNVKSKEKSKESGKSHEEEVEDKSTLEKFIKFLPLMLSVYEMPYYVENPKRLMDSKESLDIIESFCEAIGMLKNHKEDDLVDESKDSLMSIPHVIYLAISMIKHEAGELPRAVTRAIEGLFDDKISNKKKFLSPSERFLPFCLKLTNVLYNKPDSFYQRLSRSATSFGVSTDMQNFFKIVTCSHIRGFEGHLPASTIENNLYLMKIAKQMNAKPKELLGLIDLIHGKKSSDYISYFFQSLLVRMDLKPELLETLKAVCILFASWDEAALIQAVKTLDLDFIGFLLVGKHLLNPKFLPPKFFNQVGIYDESILKERKTIYNAPHEKFSRWKSDVSNELKSSIGNYKQKYSDLKNNDKDKKFIFPKEFATIANLVKLYFSDWKNFTYSKKNITEAIKVLSNTKNKLNVKLLTVEQDKNFNGVDYIARVMIISVLQLKKGKKFNKLDREQEIAVKSLSEYLGFNPEVLRHFLRIFLLNDKDAVMKSFFSFFEDERQNETEINKILGFAFTQAAGIESQLDFINDEFANSIEFFGNSSAKVPGNLIKKIYFGSSYGDLDLNDMHELISMKIDNLKLSEEDNFKIQSECVNISLLAKGVLDFDFSIHLKNDNISQLIKIISDVDIEKKYSEITKMFPKYKYENKTQIDQKTCSIFKTPLKKIVELEHPTKIAFALLGLLTYGKFSIQSQYDTSKTPKMDTIAAYLGAVFNIHQEFFDLFYIVFEHDVSRFFQKSLPLIRRLSNQHVIDINLLESLFCLAIGEKFNAFSLSEKLGVAPNIIEFFVSLVRITSNTHRKSELENIEQSAAVGQILSKLRIKPEEFISLSRLILNEFEMTEEGITSILKDLGLQNENKNENDEKKIIEVDLLKGLMSLSAPTNPKLDIFKNKKELAKLRDETATFWNLVELVNHKQDAFIISRLAAGDFLVLEEFKDYLSWIFPSRDSIAERAILNLTMGLVGLIHPNVEKYPELNGDVEKLVQEFYPKEKFSFEEPEYKVDATVLPKNSLAYAIYLTYQTLDIPPKWTQAFLFDKKAVKSISNHIKNLNEEFIWTLVLQFKNLNDVVGDLFGLYDWTINCKKFYEDRKGHDVILKPKVGEFLGKIDLVYKFFHDKMRFSWKDTINLAHSQGLLEDKYFKKLFTADKLFYVNKINQALFYLLTIKKEKEQIEFLGNKLADSFGEPAIKFIELFAYQDKEGIGKDTQDKDKTVGKLLREAIITAYEVVYKMYKFEQKRDEHEHQHDHEHQHKHSHQHEHGHKHEHGHQNEHKHQQKHKHKHEHKHEDEQKGEHDEQKPVVETQHKHDEPRYPGFAITDLCMIADLTSLKSSSGFSSQRKLHCLHQILTNIERKMLFDENLCKMSKFKIMKLLGIPLNIRLSNILEWCLAPSLFNFEYVESLKNANNEEEKKIVKEKKVELALIKEDQKSPESTTRSSSLGDLGKFSSSYGKYCRHIIKILEVDTWDKINEILQFDSAYFMHPQDENFLKSLEDMEKKDRNLLMCMEKFSSLERSPTLLKKRKHTRFGELEKSDAEVNYKSRELVEITLKQENLDNIFDVKTGLRYKELIEKSLQFEKALMSENTAFILNIIKGEHDNVLKGNHVLNKQDPKKETTKLYMSLIGLQSFSKSKNKDRSAFSNCLQNLFNYIESDLVVLDELLGFLINCNQRFVQVSNRLDVADNVLSLLLLSVKALDNNTNDEGETTSLSSILKKADLLEIITKDELEAIDIIRQVYLLKESKGWIYAIDKLSKDDRKETFDERFLRRVFSIVPMKDYRKWKEKEIRSLYYQNHPLEKIIRMIDFSKLKRQVLAGEDRQIINAMEIPSADYSDCVSYILNNVVLQLPQYQKITPEQAKAFIENYNIMNSLLRKDFACAFQDMILEDYSIKYQDENEISKEQIPKEDSKSLSGWPKVEELLKQFGLEPKKEEDIKEIKIFILYIVLSQTDMGSFRIHKNYDKAVKRITEDLVDKNTLGLFEEVFGNSENDKYQEFRKQLSQLLVGALAWDLDLCIKSLATETTLKEGYFLYYLNACLNMDKILSFNKHQQENLKIHVRGLLPFIAPKLLLKTNDEHEDDNIPNSPNDVSTEEGRKNVFDLVISDHLKLFGVIPGLDLKNSLQMKSSKLSTNLILFEVNKKPKTLLKRICNTFEENENEIKFTENTDYQIFEDILCSFCDGTILIKLVNMFSGSDKKILKEVIHLLLELKKSYGKPDTKHVHDTFLELIESINQQENKQIWKYVDKLTPSILKILFAVQREDRQILEKQKSEIFEELKNLVNFNQEDKDDKDKNDKSFLFDSISVMLGNESITGPDEIIKTRFDMDFDQRFTIFFDKICSKMLPQMKEANFLKNYNQNIYHLITVLKVDYLAKIGDRKSRQDIVRESLDTFEALNICSKAHVKILLDFLDGDMKGIDKIILELDPKISRGVAKLMSEYFQDIRKYFEPEVVSETKALPPSVTAFKAPKLKIDSEEWASMMKKIKDGTTNSRDLFRMVDQEGDGSGTINEEEFLILAGRLGLKLSEHRAQEIFSKVKVSKTENGDFGELNEEEFEKALIYLENKNLMQALELLGITPEILTAILIRLTILLLLIFLFLYLGLKAFAIGGTFGSIVNSIFPIVGGVALGKEKQGEESLEDERVEDATKKGFDIATSGEL